jgi:hypothetical protein
MKALRIAAGIALFACNWACVAQTSSHCGRALDASLRSGAVLLVDSLSAGIEVVATDQETIHATCKTEDAGNNADIYLQLAGTPTHSKLTITGTRPRHDHLQIRIEVPRKVNLDIQMPAGQVTVNEVVGDKKINLHAGQITISSPHTSDYKKIDVSVGVGQVSAPAYGEDKGGFFRSFQKENPEGEYLLQAHVAAGQIELLSKSRTGAESN